MRWDEAQGRYVRSESDYGGLDTSVIRSVLGEIGGDAMSLFVDPLKPLYWEFQNMAKYNIGITAGVETTVCPPEW